MVSQRLSLICLRKKLSSKSPQDDPDEFRGSLIKTELTCAPNMLTTAIRPLTTVIGDDDDDDDDDDADDQPVGMLAQDSRAR